MKSNMKSLLESWKRFEETTRKKDILLENSINRVLNNDLLREAYLEEYKKTLKPGEKVTEAGFGDFVARAKEVALGRGEDRWEREVAALDDKNEEDEENKTSKKGVIDKVKDYGKGIMDIGFLARGSTLLGGQETFSMEKRQQLREKALQELQQDLNQLEKAIQDSQIETDVNIKNAFKMLDDAGFPNNKKKSFESDLKAIDSLHDNIVKEWNNGQYDATTANAMIAVLRHMVIYFQDFKIVDKNLYLNEEDAGDKFLKSPERFGQIKGRSMDDVSKNYQAAYSKKLPLSLLAGGAVIGGIGLASDPEGLGAFFDGLKNVNVQDPDAITKQIVKTMTEPLTFSNGQGITQALMQQTGVSLTPNDPISNFLNPKLKVFIPAVKEGIIAKNGPAAGQLFDSLLQKAAGPDGSMKLGEVLKGAMSGTGANPQDLFDVDPGTYGKKLTENITDALNAAARMPPITLAGLITKTLGKAALFKLAGAAGMAVGGVTSAAMRLKGYVSSRMSSLQKLYDTLVDVGTKNDAVVPAGETKPGGPQEPKAGASATQEPEQSTALIAKAAAELQIPDNTKAIAAVKQQAMQELPQAQNKPEAIRNAQRDFKQREEEIRKLASSGNVEDMRKMLQIMTDIMKSNNLYPSSPEEGEEILKVLAPGLVLKQLEQSPEVKQLAAASTDEKTSPEDIVTTPGIARMTTNADSVNDYRVITDLVQKKIAPPLTREEIIKIVNVLAPLGVLFAKGSYIPSRIQEEEDDEDVVDGKKKKPIRQKIWQDILKTQDYKEIMERSDFKQFALDTAEKSGVERVKVKKLLVILLRLGLLGRPAEIKMPEKTDSGKKLDTRGAYKLNTPVGKKSFEESMRWKKLAGIIK